jgi:aspartate aminotransferase
VTILNNLIATIPASPTLAMSEKASRLAQEGHKVINLSVGEPDLPPPAWALDAADRAIKDRIFKYTPVAGLPQLQKAIVEKLERENNLSGYVPQQVLVGCGAKQVIYNAFMVSLESHHEVIIPAPYWVSYLPMVALAGGRAMVVKCPEENLFKITAQQLEDALTPQTRWFILNSPGNPTGSVYSPQELMQLGEVLRRHPHVWILSDDIYEHLTYSPASFTSLLQVCPDLTDRTLLVNGLSKSFSMTGWRLGYGVGPQSLISGMSKLQSHSTSGANCIAQYAAIEALSSHQSPAFIKERQTLFAQRRDALMQALKGFSPHISSPEGAFYVYVNVRHILESKNIASDIQLAHSLLEQVFVSTVPGTEFGLDGYLRLSYATDITSLEKAAALLTQWAQS